MPAQESWVRYLITWVALLLLAILSLCLSFLPLGAASLPVSLLLAVVMAMIALLFFMHLEGARFSVALVPLAVVFYVALLVALMVVDVASRRTFPPLPLPSLGEPAGE